MVVIEWIILCLMLEHKLSTLILINRKDGLLAKVRIIIAINILSNSTLKKYNLVKISTLFHDFTK